MKKFFFFGKLSKEVSSPSLRRRASCIKKFLFGKYSNDTIPSPPSRDKSSKKGHFKKSFLDLCCARARTPDIQPPENLSQACDTENDDSLESLSHSSSNVDGEKEEEKIALANNNRHLTEDHFENGCSGRQHLPPRFHHTASRKPRQLSQSFRETKAASALYFEHESTRKVAKKVVERLSQSRAPAKVSLEYADADGPITIEEMVTPFQPIPNRRKSSFWTLQEIQEESLIKERGKSSSLGPKSRKTAESSSTMTSARQVVTSIASKKNLKKDGGLSSFVQPKKLFKDGVKCAATTNKKPQRPGRVVATRYNQSTNQSSVARKRSLHKKRSLSIGKSQSESKNLGTESRVKKKWEIPSEIVVHGSTESEKSPLSIAVKPDLLRRIRIARCANETPRDSGPAKRVAEFIGDSDLLRKFKEAEQRAVFLSEELEGRNFLRGRDLSVPVLIQTIRSLTEEKVQMAFEVSSILRDQVAERAATKEEVRLLKAELNSQRRRLEAENNELKSTLGNELERRSTELSVKLEKYHAEERGLLDRLGELSETNVSLQMVVSELNKKETDNKSQVSFLEKQLEDSTRKTEEASKENQNLMQQISQLQQEYRVAEEDRDYVQKNYEEKVKECEDLHQSIARLQRTCNEQGKTIDGLRGFVEDVGKKSPANYDNQLERLQMEQLRLVGSEVALRKDLESCRFQVNSLRQENISLLDRLRGHGKEGGFSTFKLDQELCSSVSCLENQALGLLRESSQLGGKLLEYAKGNVKQTSGMGGQFLIECNVKIQGFKRGIENLRSSLQTISSVINEKSCPVNSDFHQQNAHELKQLELKAETLLTIVLREKLCSKERNIEQLHAELAAAVRGNDIFKCEAQNALDTISCANHKMKDFELQMMKKEEHMNQLQYELHECMKELSMVKSILSKVSQERDKLWEDVKQYSEKNMLLNSENSSLKQKVEVFEEEVLLKEGQITILKDSNDKLFDLLGNNDFTEFFLLD